MPAARDTSKADDTKTDDGAPTSSTSATDASTTQGASQDGVTRVQIEQAPAEPAVYYGEGGLVPGSAAATDPNKPHVKAEYKPFEW